MPQPGQNAVVEALIRQRQLSTRHGNMARSVDLGHDPAQEARMQDSNVAELTRELDRARDPKIRAVLLMELSKLQPQGLVGPTGVGEMLRPANGPQMGPIYSDSTSRLSLPGGYNAQDPGMLNPTFRDPALVERYESRRHGVYYPREGGSWQSNQAAEM